MQEEAVKSLPYYFIWGIYKKWLTLLYRGYIIQS
nr:MAG TPA: hypothetical protein [Caudoviricetes sp.]